MLIETDMTGNFVGSSYGWATTRDWAKFGLLHLNKGNWNGEQLFSENWIKYIPLQQKGLTELMVRIGGLIQLANTQMCLEICILQMDSKVNMYLLFLLKT